jgi:hypothetical protein
MANRRLLHRTRLDAFLEWCASKGHSTDKKTRNFEVARVRVDGWKNPVLIYDRHDGDHLTVFGNGERLVVQFCRESRVAA